MRQIVLILVLSVVMSCGRQEVSEVPVPAPAVPAATPKFVPPEGEDCPEVISIIISPLLGRIAEGTPSYEGRYKHLGFCGSIFNTKCGIIIGLEGNLVGVHCLDGGVWLVEFGDREDDYWAMISSSSHSHCKCGADLPEDESVPACCVITERILTREESEMFLRQNLSQPDVWLGELRRFLSSPPQHILVYVEGRSGH